LKLGNTPFNFQLTGQINLCASYQCITQFISYLNLLLPRPTDVLSVWHLMLFQNRDWYFILQDTKSLLCLFYQPYLYFISIEKKILRSDSKGFAYILLCSFFSMIFVSWEILLSVFKVKYPLKQRSLNPLNGSILTSPAKHCCRCCGVLRFLLVLSIALEREKREETSRGAKFLLSSEKL